MLSKCVKLLNSTVDEVCNVDISFLVGNYGAGLLEFPALCSLRANLHECWSNLCVINPFHHIDAERTSFNLAPSDGHIQIMFAVRDWSVTHSPAAISVVRDFVSKKEPLRCLDFYLQWTCMAAFNRCIPEAVFCLDDKGRLNTDFPRFGPEAPCAAQSGKRDTRCHPTHRGCHILHSFRV